MPYKNKAYSKVDHVLTWMESEYTFAKAHLSSLQAAQKFFFYENPLPYQKLDTTCTDAVTSKEYPIYHCR